MVGYGQLIRPYPLTLTFPGETDRVSSCIIVIGFQNLGVLCLPPWRFGLSRKGSIYWGVISLSLGRLCFMVSFDGRGGFACELGGGDADGLFDTMWLNGRCGQFGKRSPSPVAVIPQTIL